MRSPCAWRLSMNLSVRPAPPEPRKAGRRRELGARSSELGHRGMNRVHGQSVSLQNVLGSWSSSVCHEPGGVRSADLQICCLPSRSLSCATKAGIADLQVGGLQTQVWRPAAQQAWRPALRSTRLLILRLWPASQPVEGHYACTRCMALLALLHEPLSSELEDWGTGCIPFAPRPSPLAALGTEGLFSRQGDFACAGEFENAEGLH